MLVKNMRLFKSLSALSRAFAKQPANDTTDLGEIFKAKEVRTHLDLNERTIEYKRNEEGVLMQQRLYTDQEYLKLLGMLTRPRNQPH